MKHTAPLAKGARERAHDDDHRVLCRTGGVGAVCQAVLDALPFYVLLVDAEHRIVGANRAVQQDLGRSPEALCGEFCPQAVHDQQGPYDGCPLEEAVKRKEAVERDVWNRETERWLRSAVYPSRLVDEQGKQVYVHFARDVTPERETLERLERSYEHHRALADLLEALQTLDEERQVLETLADRTMSLSWMQVAYGASGFLVRREGGLERVVVRNLDRATRERCDRGDPSRCLCGLVARSGETLLAERETLLNELAEMAGPVAHDHGHATIPLVYSGETLAVMNFYLEPGCRLDPAQVAFLEAAASVAAVSLAQIRAWREAHQARAEKRDLERKLLGRVIQSQEEERRRVARELHDDLGQALSALLLEIQSGAEFDAPWFASYRRRLDRSIRGIIDKVSRLSWELRPSILDDYGLCSAAARYVERLRSLTDMDVDFQAVPPPGADARLPPEVEVVLYRIMQEALTNVVRHAQARRVSVLLVQRPDAVTLLVEDDGVGFSPDEEARRRGEQCLGLLGMQERVALVQGTLRIESAPGRGTAVKATIPLRREGPEEEPAHEDSAGR